MTESQVRPHAVREPPGPSRLDPVAGAGRDRRDIETRDDISALLRDFYGRAFLDPLLGPVFVGIARMNLAEHLPVMCDFWQTALFHTGGYRRNAFVPHQLLHQKANLTPQHFGRWLALWRAALHERHWGQKADLADLHATRIAGSMCRRITGSPVPPEHTQPAAPGGSL